jgi:hypothetical protein
MDVKWLHETTSLRRRINAGFEGQPRGHSGPSGPPYWGGARRPTLLGWGQAAHPLRHDPTYLTYPRHTGHTQEKSGMSAGISGVSEPEKKAIATYPGYLASCYIPGKPDVPDMPAGGADAPVGMSGMSGMSGPPTRGITPYTGAFRGREAGCVFQSRRSRTAPHGCAALERAYHDTRARLHVQ